MQTEEFLREATALPGLSGNERAVAEYIAKAFRPWCDEVRIDALNSVIGHMQGRGPRVMLCAHLDEIGLMVSRIEKDGALRIRNVGGVDPRILPGMRVTVPAGLSCIVDTPFLSNTYVTPSIVFVVLTTRAPLFAGSR